MFGDDKPVRPQGLWRNSDSMLRIGYTDGTTEHWVDCPLEDCEAALVAVKRATGSERPPKGTDWYVSIHEEDLVTDTDGNGENGQDRQDGDRESDDGDGGDQGAGDDSQGDPQGAESDDGDDSDDGGDEQDGQQDDQKDDDQKDDNMNFEDRDKTGEDDGFPENPFVDKLWEEYRPRVRQIAHHYAEYAANYAIKNGGGGGGNDGRVLLQFDGGDIGSFDETTHEMFPKVLAAVKRGLNVYLPGPPGTGKSHMVSQIAKALDIPFGVTSFSTMSTESKLLGFRNAHGEIVRTVFRDRYEFGGAMLLDELDNSNPAVVAVTNGGLANGWLEFPDGVVERHENFVCIATANTLGTGPTAEFAGRQKLDPATLNRFVKIFIDTDEAMEDKIIHGMIGAETGAAWLKKVRHVRRAVADLRIKHFVTMRDSINGARLIAPGAGKFSQVDALHHTVLAVLPEDQVTKIKAWRG